MNESEFNPEIRSHDPYSAEEYRADSISQWLNDQDPLNFETALGNALERHKVLYDMHAAISPAEAREMAGIEEAILSLMRINERLPKTGE